VHTEELSENAYIERSLGPMKQLGWGKCNETSRSAAKDNVIDSTGLVGKQRARNSSNMVDSKRQSGTPNRTHGTHWGQWNSSQLNINPRAWHAPPKRFYHNPLLLHILQLKGHALRPKVLFAWSSATLLMCALYPNWPGQYRGGLDFEIVVMKDWIELLMK
jgi:hypothetical protein